MELALEQHGALVDERDRVERERTRVLLERGALGLVPSAALVFATRPVRALRALALAIAMACIS